MRFSSTQSKKFKKIDMTYNNIKKYKIQNRGLAHVRTGTDYKGYIYIDVNDTVVGFINMRKSDNYIQALEVDKKYQNQGIGGELLQDLISMGANKLSVNKNNKIAKDMYDRLFSIESEDDMMYYMVLKESVKPQVLTEAPKDEGGDLNATDYGEMEDVEVDTATDDDITGEENPSEETDDLDAGEDNPVGDEEDDLDNTGEEPGNDSGENINEEQPNNVSGEESQEDNAKNKYLINDFIELYNRLEEIIEKINNATKINKTRDPRSVQSRINMEQIKDVLYDYITTRFDQESYVFNLYQFNLFIQAINVNVELLSSAFKNPLEKKKKRKK